MSEEEKIRAVRTYLEREFPGYAVEDWEEAGKAARCYKISTVGGVHHAVITRAFMETRQASEIAPSLEEFTLVEHLRELGATRVIVTASGLELEGE